MGSSGTSAKRIAGPHRDWATIERPRDWTANPAQSLKTNGCRRREAHVANHRSNKSCHRSGLADDPSVQKSKTLALTELLAVRRNARADGKTVVHCHGCFDIVHPGHIKHLQHARSLGDLLVVSISADSHVN